MGRMVPETTTIQVPQTTMEAQTIQVPKMVPQQETIMVPQTTTEMQQIQVPKQIIQEIETTQQVREVGVQYGAPTTSYAAPTTSYAAPTTYAAPMTTGSFIGGGTTYGAP